ncbi:hypothetical protein SAMN05519105_4724 [Rhodobacter sp. 24-YEA-8]|nr:hypothetical protein SAMN05519105_4724 [Rhodobacter sp. 24-YEA-8]
MDMGVLNIIRQMHLQQMLSIREIAQAQRFVAQIL